MYHKIWCDKKYCKNLDFRWKGLSHGPWGHKLAERWPEALSNAGFPRSNVVEEGSRSGVPRLRRQSVLVECNSSHVPRVNVERWGGRRAESKPPAHDMQGHAGVVEIHQGCQELWKSVASPGAGTLRLELGLSFRANQTTSQSQATQMPRQGNPSMVSTMIASFSFWVARHVPAHGGMEWSCGANIAMYSLRDRAMYSLRVYIFI